MGSLNTKWFLDHFTSLPLWKWSGCEMGRRWPTSFYGILWSTFPTIVDFLLYPPSTLNCLFLLFKLCSAKKVKKCQCFFYISLYWFWFYHNITNYIKWEGNAKELPVFQMVRKRVKQVQRWPSPAIESMPRFLATFFPLLRGFFPIWHSKNRPLHCIPNSNNLLNILGIKYPFKQQSSEFSTNATWPILGK